MELRKKYIAEFVYGATDGTVTTFAIIAGVLGASLSPIIVIILGFANLFADGFSMAVSNYLAEKSEDSVNGELKNEIDEKSPIKTATVTFISFIFIGFIPLISFVVAPFNVFVEENQFTLSIILTGLAFVLIGCLRGLATERNRFLSVFETLVIGGAAAVIAFTVGHFLRGIIG